MRIRGWSEPCNHDLSPLIRGGTGKPYSALPALTWASAVPPGKGTISGPKVSPPSVDRRIRVPPLVPLPSVMACQATQTSPLGATSTSDGQVNPSPAPERLPASVVQVAPWLVERAKRTGAPDWLKSCQTTYRLLANGLDGFASAATHSLSRFPVATATGPPTNAPVEGLTCWEKTLMPLLGRVRNVQKSRPWASKARLSSPAKPNWPAGNTALR